MYEDDNVSCDSKPLVLPESHSSWSNHHDPGNMTVVSSDRVTFYVPKSFMGRHCQLFHDMFSLPSDNNDPNHLACQPIFLTDAFCETSDSVSFFLFALTNDVFPRDKANLGENPVKTFHASIELATKWDCPLVLRTLEGWLSRLAFERWGDDHFKPLQVFILAAKGNMPNVARMVIELDTLGPTPAEVRRGL
ncbi:hypothetical protein B9479_001883 [Cryptococcus floricola]|uniref:BTB domain-containing protein n=1 Tax=Cryptococcus floricola TaxID=2591691 RepID=A0A5D3B3D8_9TREE|nr:hypothetical protein B9479_001883 [Cryptococcus floricola]